MALLLAVAAAEADGPDELPTVRALILDRVVRDVVRRWEAVRTDPLRIGRLEGQEATNVLLDGFAIIAGEIAHDGANRPSVATKLGAHIGVACGLASTPAAARRTM